MRNDAWLAAVAAAVREADPGVECADVDADTTTFARGNAVVVAHVRDGMAMLVPSIDHGGGAWHAERVMHGAQVAFACESSTIGMAAAAVEELLR
ncbi:MAG: hypothetical protein M1314_01425 [Firmicutes bacterium]|nr:hypothetical protein [Bacillota bacterium]